ncbi:MAG: glycosyltransferase family 2 protein [Carnobacterium sp.]|nr:glycosyltransferase family 2 protein [Carnobacterium sp.]
MNEKKKQSDLGIIIVTYNPDVSELLSNVSKYIKTAHKVIIIDNSETAFNFSILEENNKIEIIRLNSNKGIAYAQNLGIEYFLNDDTINYILFFDQDSFLNASQINELYQNYKYFEESGVKIGLVGPTINNKKSGIDDVEETLSSGSLIKKDRFIYVGSFNESLFIDLVDYDWCWRARYIGYSIKVNNNVFLNHKLGEGKKLIFKVSKEFRHYYQFRNAIVLSSKIYIPKKYKIKIKFSLPIKFIVYTTIFNNRKLRFNYIIKGIKDGKNKKLGKMT